MDFLIIPRPPQAAHLLEPPDEPLNDIIPIIAREKRKTSNSVISTVFVSTVILVFLKEKIVTKRYNKHKAENIVLKIKILLKISLAIQHLNNLIQELHYQCRMER